MKGGVTVIGLTPGSFTIEDIKVTVPFQTAVQIPAHLAQRSRNLGEAIHQQRVMQLGNALPAPVVPHQAPPLTPILRGRGIAPHNPVGVRQGDGSWQREREGLLRELEVSRSHGTQLQGINEALQAALEDMSSKLSQIQQTLSGMGAATAVGTSTARQDVTRLEPTRTALEDDVPMFIPPTTDGAAEVRISIPETTSESDLSDARGALRSLRGKSPP